MPTILQVTLTLEGVAVLWRCGEGPEQLMCAENLARAAERIHRACSPVVLVSPPNWEALVDAELEVTVDLTEACKAVLRRILGDYAAGEGSADRL